MALASMTGFARAEGAGEGCGWAWEARSVNGRGLEVRCRVPSGFDAMDAAARAAVAKRFRRGNVNLALTLARAGATARYVVNRPLLDELVAMLRDMSVDPLRMEALFAVRGVVEPAEEQSVDIAALAPAIAASLDAALDGLASARLAEGARLGGSLATLLDEMDTLRAAAQAAAAAQPAALRARLQAQLADIAGDLPALAPERLAQEVALLVAKADIREELDRLAAHAAAARELLAEAVAVGRRLDFLCQEFNREVNTLCSKSADIELTRIGLALKAVVEQVREQVQNIE